GGVGAAGVGSGTGAGAGVGATVVAGAGTGVGAAPRLAICCNTSSRAAASCSADNVAVFGVAGVVAGLGVVAGGAGVTILGAGAGTIVAAGAAGAGVGGGVCTTEGVPAGAGGKSSVEGAAGGNTPLRPLAESLAFAAAGDCSSVLRKSSRAFSSSVPVSALVG